MKDELQSYGDYTPKNYDSRYEGEVTMSDAITYSKNAPAVWTLNEIGVETGKSYLKANGIDIPDEGLALALGGLEKAFHRFSLPARFIHLPRMGRILNRSLSQA